MPRSSRLASGTLLLYGSLLVFGAAPARGARFEFIGDGGSQNLHWIWSSCCPTQSCLTNLVYPCGAVFAVNGEIPLTGYNPSSDTDNQCLITKGKLEWSAGAEGPTGQLSAVALTWVRHGRLYPGIPCANNQDGWASVDARDVPLEFVAIQEVGDPPTLNLAVSPRLDGTISQRTLLGTSTVTLQYMVSVRVNGTEVTGDTLSTQVSIPDSTEIAWTPQLPDGAANDVVIAGLPWGSQISISLWSYMRGETVGPHSRVAATSSYGDGLALVVHAWAANAVAVEDEPAPEALWLSAGPNPTAGSVRIQYALPERSKIRVAVFDLTGRRMVTLAERTEPAGRGAIVWDGGREDGSRLCPGVYLVELLAGSQRTVEKVALLGR